MDKKDKKINKDQKLLKKCEELEQNWKRAVADYVNLKKRTESERIEFVKYATKELILDVLQALDNFESVLQHTDDKNFEVSVSFFRDILKRHGVEEINVINEEFDSNTSEAVELISGEKNKVLEVLQKGYLLNGLLLRPARVKVGNGN